MLAENWELKAALGAAHVELRVWTRSAAGREFVSAGAPPGERLPRKP